MTRPPLRAHDRGRIRPCRQTLHAERLQLKRVQGTGHQVVDWIADYLANVGDYPVMAEVKPGQLTSSLPTAGPDAGEPMQQILDDFRTLIIPAVTHWNHPRFMAYFATSASGPGILGEMLSGALNVNGMVWKSCPAVVELEQVGLFLLSADKRKLEYVLRPVGGRDCEGGPGHHVLGEEVGQAHDKSTPVTCRVAQLGQHRRV